MSVSSALSAHSRSLRVDHFSCVLIIAFLAVAGCGRDPKALRDKYFASGQKYLENKRYEEASIEFRNALRLDRDHVPSNLGIAKAFQQMGDHQDAIAAYQQVVNLDSRNVQARLQLGNYMLAAGIQNPQLFKQVQRMTEEALKIEPSNVEALILLGNAYAGQNKTDESIRQLEKALLLDRENLKAALSLASVQFRKNDVLKAEETFKKALQEHPKDIQAYLSAATFYALTRRPQDTEYHLKKAFDLAPADSRCLYSLATFYLSAKRPAEAKALFKEAIARRPNDREPRWGLASFYLQQGLVDKGIQALDEVLKVSPDDRAVQLRLAEIYLDLKDEGKAEQRVQMVLAANRDDAEAHYLQGKILRRRRQTDKALAEFETSIRLNASLYAAYLEKANLLLARGDIDGAQGTLGMVLQRDRNNLPAKGALAKVLVLQQKPQDALEARGDGFRLLGRPDEAKKDYEKLCELRPQNGEYWHRLGTIESIQGNSAPALTHLRKAVELKPDLVPAINDIIYLLLKAGQTDAALAELDRLSKLSSPQDEIHRLRGQVYLAKGNESAAEKEFRRTIELNPQNRQTYVLLAQLNIRRNNIPEALKEVDKLIARNSRLGPAYLMKGYYLELAKDTKGAIAAYHKALELDPESVLAANNLAWLLCENNQNLEEALSLAKAARRKAPEDAAIADSLGWIYYKMKNYTLAVNQLEFSINNRRQSGGEHYYRLGMAYYAKGDIKLAKQTLRKSLEIDPNYPGAHEARQILRQP